MVKQIFIDTDMGADCDDVAAVAILAHFHKLGKINLLGVSHTSAHPRTVEYLDMVCRFYGYQTESLAAAGKEWGIGELREEFFNDVLSGFTYCETPLSLNAVQLMRKQLSNAKDVTVLCIGPLNNMSRFLDSQPDEISPLSGKEILAKNVKEVVIMGGIFDNKRYEFYGEIFEVEYNIKTDACSSKNFIENCPAKITFVEFELGYNVKTFADTVASAVETPIKRAYKLFKADSRESWDVVAALYCLFGENGYYRASADGECVVDEKGKTNFYEKQGGRHRYLIETESKEEIVAYIRRIEHELF
jgi:inosine-uridine nucleoside N-ribohydrolase